MSLDIIGPANAPNSVTARPADDRSFGTTDTWFKDCSSSAAIDGTKWKSAVANAMIGAWRSLIRMNGNTAGAVAIVTEDNADDAMAVKAIQHLVQRGQPRYGVDTGMANVLAVSLTPALAEYKAGLEILVKMLNTNTTTAPTLNVNGLGAKSLAYGDGSTPQPGDLKAGEVVSCRYDGTKFQIGVTRAGVLNVQRTQVVAERGSSTQSVPDSVSTKITAFGSVSVQSQGGTTFSAGLLTVGAGDAGLWFVSFHSRQQITTVSGFTNAIHINASATPIMTDGANTPAGGAIAHGAGGRLVNLAAGDTVEMRLIQTSGSTVVFNDLYDMTAIRLGAS